MVLNRLLFLSLSLFMGILNFNSLFFTMSDEDRKKKECFNLEGSVLGEG